MGYHPPAVVKEFKDILNSEIGEAQRNAVPRIEMSHSLDKIPGRKHEQVRNIRVVSGGIGIGDIRVARRPQIFFHDSFRIKSIHLFYKIHQPDFFFSYGTFVKITQFLRAGPHLRQYLRVNKFRQVEY